MSKFKLNSNQKVIEENQDIVFPDISKGDYFIRSISFTPEMETKLNKLRAKYQVSRSAVIRILLEKAAA